jgi:hypothetical protein
MWLNSCLSKLTWIRTVLQAAVLLIFFFLCSTSAMLRYLKYTMGWLLQLLGWPFITCFFRIDGLWRVFVWLWLNFCCQCRIKPFFPALFLLCSALSRLSWLLQLWDPWAAFLLGLLQVVLASLLVFLFASSLAWLNLFIERVALRLWLSF